MPPWPGPPKDPPAEVDEMEVEEMEPDLDIDANHAWNPRERVIIRRTEDYLTKKSEEILVEVGELEAHLLCPTDVTGIVDVLAKNACDQVRRRRFVFVKTKEGHLVAGMRQRAFMRARMEPDYQELQVIIGHMNVKQGGLLATMVRKQS